MLFGKYINKYYLKFSWLFLIGLIGLVAVDVFQLFIPEYLGKLVDMFDGGAIDKAALKEIILGVMVVAIVMFFGRIMWRLSIFNASQRIVQIFKNRYIFRIGIVKIFLIDFPYASVNYRLFGSFEVSYSRFAHGKNKLRFDCNRIITLFIAS